jgi:HEAT repeat protein
LHKRREAATGVDIYFKNPAQIFVSVVGRMGVIKSLKDALGGEKGESLDDLSGDSHIKNALKALSYGDVEDRWNAIRAIGELGEPFIEPLVRALNDDYWIVRRGAGDALSKIGYPAVPSLIKMLENVEEDVRRETERALVLIGEPAVRPLLDALIHENAQVRKRSVQTLGLLQSPEALPAIISALKDSDPLVRQEAALSLAGYADPVSVTPLIELLKDEHGYVRMAAVETLCIIGQEAIDPLIHALGDGDEQLRQRSSFALVTIGSPAVDRLIDSMQSENPAVTRSCAWILGRIGDNKAIPHLVLVTGHQDRYVRREVCDSLAAMGDAAVLPLTRSFRDGEILVRHCAMEALWMIGTPAVEYVADLLTDPSPDVRKRAALLLGEIGVRSAIDPLSRLLGDENPSVRRVAFEAIEMIKTKNINKEASSIAATGPEEYERGESEERQRPNPW